MYKKWHNFLCYDRLAFSSDDEATSSVPSLSSDDEATSSVPSSSSGDEAMRKTELDKFSKTMSRPKRHTKWLWRMLKKLRKGYEC